MTSRRLATALCSLAAFSLIATACGDDPDEASGAGTSESTLPSSDGAPTGSGSLIIDGVSYPFDADVCSLTPVNHEARDYELYVHGTGSDGDEYEVEVFRTSSGSGNLIEVVNFAPGEGQLAAASNAVTESSGERFDVASSVLTGEIDFVATDDDLPLGTGSISVTCN